MLSQLDEAVGAEQDLLAALLTTPGAIDLYQDEIRSEWFSDPLHARIFDAMVQVAIEGGGLRARTVIAAMGRTDEKARTYVNGLPRLASETADIPYTIKVIRNHWALRQIESVMTETQEMIADGGVTDPMPLINHVIDSLDPVLSTSMGATVRGVRIREVARDVAVKAEEMVKVGPEKIESIRTGIGPLDDILRPMQPGNLVVLLGRPGQGKTAMAVTTALYNARRGNAVMFDSLEMTAFDLTERMISAVAAQWNEPHLRQKIPYNTICSGMLTDEQLRAVWNASDHLGTLPIQIEQQPGMTLSQVASRARRFFTRKFEDGARAGLLIIDYLGLMRASDRYRGQKVQELTEITQGLKCLAKELGIVILLLAQMSRQVEHREDKHPLLADARDSGSIEQDADAVLGIYREFYYLSQQSETGMSLEDSIRMAEVADKAELGVLKQRKGKTGWVPVHCDVALNLIG
jgi:replicative DNA helicase